MAEKVPIYDISDSDDDASFEVPVKTPYYQYKKCPSCQKMVKWEQWDQHQRRHRTIGKGDIAQPHNPWITFAKKVQIEMGCSYKEALIEASKRYKK